MSYINTHARHFRRYGGVSHENHLKLHSFSQRLQKSCHFGAGNGGRRRLWSFLDYPKGVADCCTLFYVLLFYRSVGGVGIHLACMEKLRGVHTIHCAHIAVLCGNGQRNDRFCSYKIVQLRVFVSLCYLARAKQAMCRVTSLCYTVPLSCMNIIFLHNLF